MTHGEWMCRNTRLNKKPFSFTRYPFQEAIANDEHPNLDCMKPSQIGLALDLTTPILTTQGWSTMGTLKVGDVIYDEQGKPCNVTYISPVYTDHVCYELEFDTGETIVADANHRWYVESPTVKGVVNSQYLFDHRETHTFSIPLPWSLENQKVTIIGITLVVTCPVRCITVDSPSHLFLASEGLIPTHNTEIQIRKTLAWAKRVPNISIIYTMPNTNMFKRISKARLLPVLEDRAFRGDGGSMDLLKVGSSYVYVTGASESDATSINADIVMNDEIDLTDPSMLSLFNSRLQGSDLRINQRFSTPTYEGFGVHSGFLVSDQQRYMLKCQCCGHWQEPVFDRRFVVIPNLPGEDDLKHLTNIDQQTYDQYDLGNNLKNSYIQCERCYKPLDVGDHANREWVAKYPSRTNARGYKITTFSTERLTVTYVIEQLLKYRRRDNMKGFYNTVLGLPYTDDNIQLSEALLRQAFTTNMDWAIQAPTDYYSVGIDVGKTCYITIAKPDGEYPAYVHFESVPQEFLISRLQKLNSIFPFHCGGIDWTPEWKLACEVRDTFNGVIMPVQYSEGKPVVEVKDMTGLVSHLSCNRTQLLDTVALGLRSGVTTLSGYGSEAQKTVLIKHFRDMVREEPDSGEGMPRWKKLSGNDHFFHACGYAVAGLKYHDALSKLRGPERSSGILLMPQPNIIVNPGASNLPNLIGFHTGFTNTSNIHNPLNQGSWFGKR